jgi:collagenase-like PrtC family protease
LDVGDAAKRDLRDLVALGDLRGRIVLALPRFMFEFSRHAEIQEALRRALDSGFRRFEVSNLGHFQILKATGRRNLDVYVAPGIGCLNSQARTQLEEMGAGLVTYAMEGDLANLELMLRRVPPGRLAVQVFGRVPVFVSRAPWKGRSRRVRLNEPPETFSVEWREGLNWAFSTRTYSILDRMEELQALGVRRFLHDLTGLREAGDAAKYVLNPAMPEYESHARATFNTDRGLE